MFHPTYFMYKYRVHIYDDPTKDPKSEVLFKAIKEAKVFVAIFNRTYKILNRAGTVQKLSKWERFKLIFS